MIVRTTALYLGVFLCVLLALSAGAYAFMAREYASLLLGGTGLAFTIVALILGSVLTHGFNIDGMPSWLAMTVVVWLVTTIGAIKLPELRFRAGPDVRAMNRFRYLVRRRGER